MSSGKRNERLVALLIFGCLVFNYPLLDLFNQARSWLGIPVLFLYLFAAWALFILLMAVIVERKRTGRRPLPRPLSRDRS